jgi:hypothetical protein
VESEPTPVLWMLVLCVPVLLLLGSATRWVARGELLVVTRRGVIVRRHAGGRRPGPVARVPLLERTHLLPAGDHDVLAAARVTTRDGDDVRVLATARGRLVPPEAGRRFVDPRAVAADAVETALGRVVADLATDDVAAALTDTDLLVGVAREADRAARPAGVELHALELDEVELLLRPQVSRRVGSR